MTNLWIGLSANEELKNIILDNGSKILSANVSQDNIYNGLQVNGIFLDTINAPQVPTFPNYKKMVVNEYCWIENGTKNISVKFLNIKYLNTISKTYEMCKKAKKWALDCNNQSPYIFVYQMHSPFMKAANVIKKILPDAKIILIVPDLPQYMDMNMSSIKKILKSVDWYFIKKYMHLMDYYILYSKYMAEFLNLQDNSWIVMEGTINDNDYITEVPYKKSKAIMYSGVCDKKYGIPLLLDAFDKIQDLECELWFTGDGNAVELIKEREDKDSRIKYLGYLPSRKDLLLKQKEAWAMINMRLPNEIASKYCFPSKIFEYMLSGNPVLSFRIAGIPDEYFEHLISIESTSVDAVSRSIQNIFDIKEKDRINIGCRGQKFILEKKNNIIQTKKILEFIRYRSE